MYAESGSYRISVRVPGEKTSLIVAHNQTVRTNGYAYGGFILFRRLTFLKSRKSLSPFRCSKQSST